MRTDSQRDTLHRGIPHVARRVRDDRGAILAEAALITPVFIALIFGIIEFGGAFRDYLTVANSASQGTRMAAIQGNTATADWTILQAVKKASGAMPQSQIDRIVIFKATGASSTVPPICKTASSGNSTVGTECNIFLPADIALGTMPVTWVCPGTASQASNPIAYWCATNRKVNVAGSGGPPDYVGIYIQTTHPWVTGLFGRNVTLSDTSVTQLEPQNQ